jgi:2-succinyl-6-hydroxy-2,4-cyclohexadiene-1-carboxylate synthase
VSAQIVALHGFLGRRSDWDAVREASQAGLDWTCPDLFVRGANSFAPPAVEGPCWLAGYSFGARLALRWLQQEPDRWLGALLLSVNPGNFQTDAERSARQQSDETWAQLFAAEPWDDLIKRWDAQEVFRGSEAPQRDEDSFDRGALSKALRKFSVAGQFTDPLRLPPQLTWLAGSRDRKFADLQGAMRDAGFPGTFLLVEEAGHRLLHESPGTVAAALDDLVA